MSQGNRLPPVSATTYLGLATLSYDEFYDQLASLHDQLQHVAIGSLSDKYLIFPGQQWCYSIVQHPESEALSNRLWLCLSGEEAYRAMVGMFPHKAGLKDACLMITNICASIAAGRNTNELTESSIRRLRNDFVSYTVPESTDPTGWDHAQREAD